MYTEVAKRSKSHRAGRSTKVLASSIAFVLAVAGLVTVQGVNAPQAEAGVTWQTIGQLQWVNGTGVWDDQHVYKVDMASGSDGKIFVEQIDEAMIHTGVLKMVDHASLSSYGLSSLGVGPMPESLAAGSTAPDAGYFWSWDGGIGAYCSGRNFPVKRVRNGATTFDLTCVERPKDAYNTEMTGGEVDQTTGRIYFQTYTRAQVDTHSYTNAKDPNGNEMMFMIWDPSTGERIESGNVQPATWAERRRLKSNAAGNANVESRVASDMALDANGNIYMLVARAEANRAALVRVIPTRDEFGNITSGCYGSDAVISTGAAPCAWKYNVVTFITPKPGTGTSWPSGADPNLYGSAFLNGKLYAANWYLLTSTGVDFHWHRTISVIDPLEGTMEAKNIDSNWLQDDRVRDFASAQTAAVIQGTVYNDVNGDGNVIGDSGLGGVTIAVYDANGKLMGTQLTDANGDYSFLVGSVSNSGVEYYVRVVQPKVNGANAIQTYASGGSSGDNGVLNVTEPECINSNIFINTPEGGKCFGRKNIPYTDPNLGTVGTTMSLADAAILSKVTMYTSRDVADANFGVSIAGSWGDARANTKSTAADSGAYHLNTEMSTVKLGSTLGKYSDGVNDDESNAHEADDGVTIHMSDGTEVPLQDQVLSQGRSYPLSVTASKTSTLSGDIKIRGWASPVNASTPTGTTIASNASLILSATLGADGKYTQPTTGTVPNVAFKAPSSPAVTMARGVIRVEASTSDISVPDNSSGAYGGTSAWVTNGEVEDYQVWYALAQVRVGLKTVDDAISNYQYTVSNAVATGPSRTSGRISTSTPNTVAVSSYPHVINSPSSDTTITFDTLPEGYDLDGVKCVGSMSGFNLSSSLYSYGVDGQQRPWVKINGNTFGSMGPDDIINDIRCDFTLSNSASLVKSDLVLTDNYTENGSTTTDGKTVAGGTITATVTVRSDDSTPMLLSGKTVYFTVPDGITVTTPQGTPITKANGYYSCVTANDGTCSIDLTASTAAQYVNGLVGKLKVHASDADPQLFTGSTRTIEWVPGAVNAADSWMEKTTSASTVVANGTEAHTEKIAQRDASAAHNPVPAETVSYDVFIDADGNGRLDADEVTATSVTPASPSASNTSGEVNLTIKTTKAGVYTVVAKHGTSTIPAKSGWDGRLTFVAGPPDCTSGKCTDRVEINPSQAVANNSDIMTITTTVTDAYGNPVLGRPVTFEKVTGPGLLDPSDYTLSSSTCSSGDGSGGTLPGGCSVTIKSAKAGVVKVAAFIDEGAMTNSPVTGTFVPGSVSSTTSELEIKAGNGDTGLAAGPIEAGQAYTAVVTVRDQFGNLVSDAPVRFFRDANITPEVGSYVTNNAGQVTFSWVETVVDGLTPKGQHRLHAEVEPSPDNWIDVTGSPVTRVWKANSTPSETNSYLQIDTPGAVEPNSYHQVKVFAYDEYGNAIATSPVVFTATPATNVSWHGGAPASGSTDSDGVYTGEVTSSVNGSVDITATLAGVSVKRVGSTDLPPVISNGTKVVAVFAATTCSAGDSYFNLTAGNKVANGTDTHTITFYPRSGSNACDAGDAEDLPLVVTPSYNPTAHPGKGQDLDEWVKYGSLGSGDLRYEVKVTSTWAAAITEHLAYGGNAVSLGGNSPADKLTFVYDPSTLSKTLEVTTSGDRVANGTERHTVKVQMVDANGNAASNQPVSLDAYPTSLVFYTSSTGPTVGAQSGTTDNSGEYYAYVGTTVAGQYTISGNGLTVVGGTQGKANFVPGPVSLTETKVSYSTDTSLISTEAGGVGGIEATITVRDANGNALKNSTIYGLAATLSGTTGAGIYSQNKFAGAYTPLTEIPNVTDVLGQIHFRIIDRVVENVTVTVKIGADGIAAGTGFTNPQILHFYATTPCVDPVVDGCSQASQIWADTYGSAPVTVTADGVAEHVVYVKAYNKSGSPLANQAVIWSTGSLTIIGTPEYVTGEDGIAEIHLATTTAGNYNVTATLAGAQLTDGNNAVPPQHVPVSISYGAGAVDYAKSSFDVLPHSAAVHVSALSGVPAQGDTDWWIVRVTAKDTNNNYVTDLSAIRSSVQFIAKTEQNSGLTYSDIVKVEAGVDPDGTGSATAVDYPTYIAYARTTKAGEWSMGATASGEQIGAWLPRQWVAGTVSAAHSSFSLVNAPNVVADGNSPQIATITVRDAFDNPIAGHRVRLSETPYDGESVLAISPNSTGIGNTSNESGHVGEFQFSLKSTQAKTYQMKAYVDTSGESTPIWTEIPIGAMTPQGNPAPATFIAGACAASASVLEVDKDTTVVGTSINATIRLKDAQGNACTTVSPPTLQAEANSAATITAPAGGQGGVYTATITDKVAQSFGLSAQVNGVTVARAKVGAASEKSATSIPLTFTTDDPAIGTCTLPGSASPQPATRIELDNTDATTPVGTGTHQITATVVDKYCNPISGAKVDFTYASPLTHAEDSGYVTGTEGQAWVKVKSNVPSASIDDYPVSARISKLGNDTVSIAILNDNDGSGTGGSLSDGKVFAKFGTDTVDISNSSWAITPAGPLAADGSAMYTVTVTLKDSLGNTVPNKAGGLGLGVSPATGLVPASPSFSALGTGESLVYQTSFASTKAELKSISVTTGGQTLASTSGNGTESRLFTAGTPVRQNSSFEVTNLDKAADGVDTQSATLTVLDAYNNPVPDVACDFSVTPSVSTPFSFTLTKPVPAKTNAQGQCVATMKTTKAGTYQVSASYTANGTEQFGPLATSFVAGAASTNTSFLTLDGFNAATATVGSNISASATVRDAFGNPISGQNVYFAVSAGVNDAANHSASVGAASAVTNSDGVASVNVTSTFADSYQVYAALGGQWNAGGDTISNVPALATFSAGVVNVNTSSIAVDSATYVAADGVGEHTITVTLRDVYSNPVAGKRVDFTIDPNLVLKPSSNNPGQTNEQGQASITVTSTYAPAPDNESSLPVSAQWNGNAIGSAVYANYRLGGASAANSVLSMSRAASAHNPVSVDDVPGWVATVLVKNTANQVVPGAKVVFTLDNQARFGNGETTAEATANSDGIATVNIYSHKLATGSQTTLTAKIGGAWVGGSEEAGTEHPTFGVGVPFTGQNADNGDPASRVTITAGDRIADGADTHTAVVYAVDKYGNKVPGARVKLTQVNADGETAYTGNTPVTISAAGATDGNGKYEFTIKSAKPGDFTLKAEVIKDQAISNPSDGDFQVAYGSPVTVSFTVGDIDASKSVFDVVARDSSPQVSDAVGVPSAADTDWWIVRVKAQDANGNPVSVPVSDPAFNIAFANIHSQDSGVYFSPIQLVPAGTTLPGESSPSTVPAYISYARTTKAGAWSLVATAGGTQVSGSPAIREWTVGGVDTSKSTFELVNKSNVLADGNASQTALVTVADKFGNPIPGKAVRITNESAGDADSALTILPNGSGEGSTSNNVGEVGQFEFTLKSTVAKTYSIKAWVRNAADTAWVAVPNQGSKPSNPASVTFVAGACAASSSVLAVDKTSATVGKNIAISITLKDAQGNLCVPNSTPVLSTTPGAKATVSAVVGSGGNYTATVSDKLAESFDLSAQVNGVTVAKAKVGSGNEYSATSVGLSFTTDEPSFEFCTDADDVTRKATKLILDTPADALTAVGEHVITAEVLDKFCNPVPNARVELSYTSPLTFRSPASDASGLTDANGRYWEKVFSNVASVNATDFQVSGTVTAPGSNTAQRILNDNDARNGSETDGLVYAKFGSGAVSAAKSDWSINPAGPLTADGQSAYTVTVHLKDSNATAVANAADAITLNVTPIDGITTSAFAPTGTMGEYTATIKSTTAGAKVISVASGGAIPSTSAGNPLSETRSFTAGAPVRGNSTFSVTKDDKLANGVDYQTATLTVRDAQSNPVSGVACAFPAVNDLTIVPAGSSTDNAGQCTAKVSTLKANTTANPSYTVSASYTAGSTEVFTDTTSFKAGAASASASKLTLTPTSQTAGSAIVAAAQIVDAQNNPISGVTVYFRVGAGAADAGHTANVGAPSALTNADGVASVNVTSNFADSYQVYAALGGQEGAGGVSIGSSPATATFTAGSVSLANSSLAIDSATYVAADGTGEHTVTATLRDALNNPISGQQVNFTLDPSLDRKATTANPATTNAQGQASITVTASYSSHPEAFSGDPLRASLVVSARWNGQPIDAAVNANYEVGGASAAHSVFTMNRCTLALCGVESHNPPTVDDKPAYQATVLVKNTAGQTVPNAKVVFTLDNGALFSNNANTIEASTDANGTAIVTLYSEKLATDAQTTLSAKIGGQYVGGSVNSGTAHPTFSVGKPFNGQLAANGDPASRVTITSGARIANGQDTHTAVIYAVDKYGNKVPGARVKLTQVDADGETAYSGNTPVTISPAGATDGNGKYEFTIKSAKPGNFTLKAEVVKDQAILNPGASDYQVAYGSPVTASFAVGDIDASKSVFDVVARDVAPQVSDAVGAPLAGDTEWWIVRVKAQDANGNPIEIPVTDPAFNIAFANIHSQDSGVYFSPIQLVPAGTILPGETVPSTVPAYISYARTTKAGAWSLVATAGSVQVAGSPAVRVWTVGDVDTSKSTFELVNKPNVLADGNASQTALVTVNDKFGNPIPGKAVRLTNESAGDPDSALTILPNGNGEGSTSNNVGEVGQFEFTLKSTVAKTYSIKAWVRNAADTTWVAVPNQGSKPSNPASATFVAGACTASTSVLGVDKTSATVGENIAVSITLKDAQGNLCVPAATPTLVIDPSAKATATAVIGSNGNYTATVSDKLAESFDLSAQVNGITVAKAKVGNGIEYGATSVKLSFTTDGPSYEFCTDPSGVTRKATKLILDTQADALTAVGEHVITAEVLDKFCNPVPNAKVEFSYASPLTFRAPASDPSGLTDATGRYSEKVFSNVASQSATDFQVSGKVTAPGGGTAQQILNDNDARNGSETDGLVFAKFSSGAVSAGQSDWSIDPVGPLTANGQAAYTVTVHLRDSNATAVANAADAITLSVIPADGVTASSFAPTGTLGEYRATIRSTVAGQKTISVASGGAISSTSAGHPVSETRSFVAGAPVRANSTFSVTKDDKIANGVDYQTATLTVRDANHNPVPGVACAFPPVSDLTVTPAGSTTSEAGQCTAKVSTTRANTSAKPSYTVSASYTEGSTEVFTDTTSFKAGSAAANTSKLTLTPSTQTAGSAIVAAAQIVDAQNNPISGVTVYFRVSGGADNSAHTANVGAPSSVTNADGVASVNVTSNYADSYQVYAALGGQEGAGGVSIADSPATATFTAGSVSLATSSLAIDSATYVAADGTGEHTVTATLRDALNNPISGQQVSFTLDPSLALGSPSSTVVTNAQGEASIVVTASYGTHPAAFSGDPLRASLPVSAKWNSQAVGTGVYANYEVGGASASDSTFSMSRCTTALCGVESHNPPTVDDKPAYQAKVVVKNTAGQTVPNAKVVFTLDNGALFSNNSNTIEASTDAQGIATVTLYSEKLASGNQTSLTAKIGGQYVGGSANTGTAHPTFGVGKPFNGQLAANGDPASRVTITAGDKTADGTASHTVKVYAVDKFGNKVPNAAVKLTQIDSTSDLSPYSGNNKVVISGNGTGFTDADGVKQFSVTSLTAGTFYLHAEVIKDQAISNPAASDFQVAYGSPVSASFVAGAPALDTCTDAQGNTRPASRIWIDDDTAVATGIGSHKVSAEVVDARCNPIVNAQVDFEYASPLQFKESSNSSGLTDATGKIWESVKSDVPSVAASDYPVAAKVFANNTWLTITNNGGSNDGKVIARFTNAAVDAGKSSWTIAPDTTLVANGTDEFTVKVTLRDVNNTYISNKPELITLSVTPLAGITVSEITATGNAGEYVAKVKSTSAGVKRFEVIAGNIVKSNYGNDYESREFTAGSAQASNSTLSVAPLNSGLNAPLEVGTNADNSYLAAVVVHDANGNLVNGTAVKFSITGADTSGIGMGGNLSTVKVVNAANGIASVEIFSTKAGSFSLKAEIGTDAVSGSPATISWKAGAPAVQPPVTCGPDNTPSTYIKVQPTGAVDADGEATHTVTVTARDKYCNPVDGAAVAFNPAAELILKGTADTKANADGVAYASYASLQASDTGFDVGATVNGVALTALNYAPVKLKYQAMEFDPSHSSVAKTPEGPLVAGSKSANTYTMKATLQDSVKLPWVGEPVSFECKQVSDAAASVTCADLVLSHAVKVTGNDGTASVTAYSNKAGSFEITVKADDVELSGSPLTLTFTAGAPDPSFSEIDIVRLTADVGESSDVIVTLKDAQGNVIAEPPYGTSVTLLPVTGAGLLGSDGYTLAENGFAEQQADGTFVGKITGKAVGRAVVGYRINSQRASDTDYIDFDITHGVELSNSTFTVTPEGTRTADGVQSFTGVVSLRNDLEVPLADVNVSFAVPEGTQAGGVTGPGILVVATDAQGQAKAEWVSRIASTYEVRAEVAEGQVGDAREIEFVSGPVSVNNSEIRVEPSTMASGKHSGAVAIVTLRDAQGNRILNPDPATVVTVITADGSVVTDIAIGAATLATDGTFRAPLTTGLQDGLATFGFRVGSQQSSKTADLEVTDGVGPEQPGSSRQDRVDDKPVVTDEPKCDGEPGSTITVTFPDGTKATTQVGADGCWTVPIPEGTPDGKTTVVATDEAGNDSDPVEIVIDTTPPDAPEMGEITRDGIDGKAEPGSTVTITFPEGSPSIPSGLCTSGKQPGQVNCPVDDQGNWRYPGPIGEKIKDGTITVTATDAAGNTSKPSIGELYTDEEPMIGGPELAPINGPSQLTVNTKKGVAIDIDVLAKYTSTAKPLVIVEYESALHGKVTFTAAHSQLAVVNADGILRYTPAKDFVGMDAFAVTIANAEGNTKTIPVFVNVADPTLPATPTPSPTSSQKPVVTTGGDTLPSNLGLAAILGLAGIGVVAAVLFAKRRRQD
ncbi:MAG: Ig-like domain-containing protein [Propionibacteriaceae bacterium]|jgi:adhesin/invasin|nr:Ig-like domain-containing protein [Propionibacteriaceae bacterium]